MGRNNNAPIVHIELDCGHIKHFKTEFRPEFDETLWCNKCELMRPIAPVEARTYGVKVYDSAGEFWTKRITGKKYLAGCTHDADTKQPCEYTGEYNNWFKARDAMHQHYMRAHTNFHATITEQITQFYPRDADPPF